MADIRVIGRSTEGVRIIKLEEGDQVRTIERVRKQEGALPRRPGAAPVDLFSDQGTPAGDTAGAVEDEEDELEDEAEE